MCLVLRTDDIGKSPCHEARCHKIIPKLQKNQNPLRLFAVNPGICVALDRISEGRSKPILDTVVGVNFASSASKSAQNLNYAV